MDAIKSNVPLEKFHLFLVFYKKVYDMLLHTAQKETWICAPFVITSSNNYYRLHTMNTMEDFIVTFLSKNIFLN